MGGVSNVVVGVLGQWASGKSTAAKILVDHLGGREQVIFLDDRKLVAAQAVEYIRRLPEAQLKRSVDADGLRIIEGPLMTVRLPPGETLDTVDLRNLLFDMHHEVYTNVPAGACNVMDTARLELGRLIQARSAEGKPMVIEAGFGTNLEPRGGNPFCHSANDLFCRLAETGLEPSLVKWIMIEASYILRAFRNDVRPDSVPAAEFDQLAGHGGDLSPAQQRALERQGATITRVSNQHSDPGRFKADIIAAYESMFVRA